MTVTDDAVHLDAANAYRLYYGADGVRPAGLVWTHRRDDGRWCSADIPFRWTPGTGAHWTVILENPLTITPALRCPACRSSGWLDGNRWRPT